MTPVSRTSGANLQLASLLQGGDLMMAIFSGVQVALGLIESQGRCLGAGS